MSENCPTFAIGMRVSQRRPGASVAFVITKRYRVGYEGTNHIDCYAGWTDSGEWIVAPARELEEVA